MALGLALGLAGVHLVTRPVPTAVAAPNVVWTVAPCGKSEGWSGCFDPATPDVVYVDPAAPDVGATLVHEFAHWEQYRDGLPLDECAAEQAVWDVLGRLGSYQLWGTCPLPPQTAIHVVAP